MIAAKVCFIGIARFAKPVKELRFVRDFVTVTSVGSYQDCRLRRLVQVLNCTRFPYDKCAFSIPARVELLEPPFSVLNYATGTKFLSVADFHHKDEVSDEDLNKLLSDISTDPDAYKHISSVFAEKLCKAGKYTALANLLEVLRKNQVTLSPNVYNILLSASGDANDGELLFCILKDMLASGLADSTSYDITAKAFMRMSDSMLLVKFAQDLSELALPTGVTFLNRIIYSFARCGQVDKALLLYHNMKRLTCKPDLATYNTVLGILGRIGRVDEILIEFSYMKESGVVPDLVSYNTLFNSLKKVGRLDLCLKYMTKMTESGLEPDLRTYTALIESFGRLGNVEEPVRLLEEMKVKGVRPSIYIYRSLVDSLKKAGKVEVAVKYLEEMKINYDYLLGPKDFKRKRRKSED